MEWIQPAPRVKNPVWKFTLWFLVMVVLGQLLWIVFSIPVFRHTVSVETQLARENNTRQRNQITTQLRELPPDMRPDPIAQALQQTPAAPSAPPVAPNLALRLRPPEPESHTREVESLLQDAKEFRQFNDIIFAKAKLLEAQRLEPKHPEVLRELGLLYESMNDWGSAKQTWQDLRSLGEAAGPLALFARDRLLDIERRETQLAMERQSRTRQNLPRDLTIANVEPQQDQQGFKSLRITIAANLTQGAVAVRDVKFQIYFFEADDEKIYPVPGESVRYDFLTVPINWAGGEPEQILIRAGPFSAPPLNYYGYLIRVFHRGQLQDEVSEPPQLAPLFSSNPKAGPQP
ncbi:MAG TPA: hypothetical protein PLU30_20315 [Verrucomicrobiae bacterium]|nr:hypothetical protein [Verrucomicrobiae bacterium]